MNSSDMERAPASDYVCGVSRAVSSWQVFFGLPAPCKEKIVTLCSTTINNGTCFQDG